METRQLGGSGVEITRVILGCGNFGGIGSAPAFFGQGESEEEALSIMDFAWDRGIRTFDTADAYGGGRSELAIGRWMRERGHRPTIETKVFHSVEGNPADFGLAPERIARQLPGSLERLGIDHVPLYLIHEPDPETTLERTLEALTALVESGRVGAIGASNADGAFLTEALEISERRGLARFEWVQNSYSLLDRGDEAEVLPLCAEHGLGYTPFSPLAGGWLAGRYRGGGPPPEGSRLATRPGPYAGHDTPQVHEGIERMAVEAERRGVSLAALAYAWLYSHPNVTGVVTGPRRPAHLDPPVEGLSLALTTEERADVAGFFS